MMKFLPLASLLLLFSFTGGIGPQIKFETESYNFGKIPQGKPVTYEFVFENTGDEPLLLMEVKASCGCTAPYYPTEPITPGEKGKIKVVFNAASPKPFHKSIRVTTNVRRKDGVAGEAVVLFIKGEVLSNSLEEENTTKSPIRVN